jgi:hypothetical protein
MVSMPTRASDVLAPLLKAGESLVIKEQLLAPRLAGMAVSSEDSKTRLSVGDRPEGWDSRGEPDESVYDKKDPAAHHACR